MCHNQFVNQTAIQSNNSIKMPVKLYVSLLHRQSSAGMVCVAHCRDRSKRGGVAVSSETCGAGSSPPDCSGSEV